MNNRFFSFQKMSLFVFSMNRIIFIIFTMLLCLSFCLISFHNASASECEKAKKDKGSKEALTCSTSATGEKKQIFEKFIDETHKTTAVPRIQPMISSPVTGTLAPLITDDPAWDLLDSESVIQRLKKSEHLAVEFDHTSSVDPLILIQPSDPLTVDARQAVDKSPTWLQKQLEESFSRLDAADQDTYAALILSAADPKVDEIAFCVANISTSDLTKTTFYPQLITDNADMLYMVDADVDYAEIVNYGDSVTGGDYYSTVRYKVKEGEDINEYEHPRDIYYWYIVHPRGSDEYPTYIDPTSTCTSGCNTNGPATAPPQGRFWREYFYGCDTDEDGTIDSACPHNYEQCDSDHDGIRDDGPCPVLRDMLMDVHVLWEMKRDVVGPTNGALGQTSEWVHTILGKWWGSDEDGCRPIQPVTIYFCQDGRCGEFQDMQTAAGRTALIPTISTSAGPCNDHVWNEFYERRWIEWQAEDRQIDHPEGHDGWTGGLAGLRSNRGDGLVHTDSTGLYSPTCQLNVTITDANGYPVDGALVRVFSELSIGLDFPSPKSCIIHQMYEQTRSLTDESGQVSFILGDNNESPQDCRNHYVKVHTTWADYPAAGNEIAKVISDPQPDTIYSWSHQFTEGSVPRLTISPAGNPPDPAIDNLIEVTYSVADEYGHGDGYHGGIQFREVMQPGNLDFFIADSSNYSLFTSDSAFEAFETAIDSTSGDISLIPPVTDDWFAVWSNEASHNFSQIVDTTVRLYENNGLIAPVCELMVDKGSLDEAILDWEDLINVNMEAYNLYRSTNAADVGCAQTQEQLAPFLVDTVYDSTYTDSEALPAGQCYFYVVRTLGKSGDIAEACTNCPY